MGFTLRRSETRGVRWLGRLPGIIIMALAVGGLWFVFIAVDNAIDAGAAADPVGWWFWVRKVALPGLVAAMFLVQALRGR